MLCILNQINTYFFVNREILIYLFFLEDTFFFQLNLLKWVKTPKGQAQKLQKPKNTRRKNTTNIMGQKAQLPKTLARGAPLDPREARASLSSAFGSGISDTTANRAPPSLRRYFSLSLFFTISKSFKGMEQMFVFVFLES